MELTGPVWHEWAGTTVRWPLAGIALVVAVAVLLVVWRRPRGPGETVDPAYVVHTDLVRSLPRYRTLVEHRARLGRTGTVAALLVATGAILLTARLEGVDPTSQGRTRDIILCLDASASMSEEDAAVIAEFREIVADLRGERIGMTIWNGAALTIFPLTDDYEYVDEQLTIAERAFAEQNFNYVVGTVLENDIVSSQVGDGLVSCVQRFDRPREERARTVILASDNAPEGTGVYTLREAAAYAGERGVVVHGIASPATTQRPGAAEQFAEAVGSTDGIFGVLGSEDSAEEVVDDIRERESEEIDDEPVVATVDRPIAGTALVGLGLLLLLWVWSAQAERREREDAEGAS